MSYKNMKKFMTVTLLSLIILVILAFFYFDDERDIQIRANEDGSLSITVLSETISAMDDGDGLLYFFMPAGAEGRIFFDGVNGDIYIDGDAVNKLTGFSWETGVTYLLETEGFQYNIIFMQSENISALFISTESGGMDYINADKANEESGTLSVLDSDGSYIYAMELESIHGRGNSTWNEEKKPYAVRLSESYPLCGMDSGKSWKLLALYYEHDKIHTKIAFDLARELGMESTPDCTWVDLYCNGEYMGLYLLTESKKSNLPDDTQWLIEKTHESRLTAEEEASSFTTAAGYLFLAESINEGDMETVDEVAAYMQEIEDLLASGDTSYRDYIDMESLAKKFLFEKIVMNYDAFAASSYFVISDDGVLSSGPAWDYDNAFGTIGFFDYTSPIEGEPDEMTEWFNVLYEDEEFREIMIEAYIELLPYFEELLSEGIDSCAEEISASVSMDLSRWGVFRNTTYIYEDYDNYVRFLKYFLASRLNYLNDLWGIEWDDFEVPESTGELHTVTFVDENGEVLCEMTVKDGDCIEELPEFDEEVYTGWCFLGLDKEYESYFPVYEDMTFEAKLIEE